jgi:LmbE family N-acetylglucosaminyl deacetylase
MTPFQLARSRRTAFRILCLGAHSDDIEIGCGGTLLRLLETYSNVTCDWVVFTAEGPRAREARTGARRFLHRAARSNVTLNTFRNGFFPSQAADIKTVFEEMKKAVSPDLIFTNYRGDLHQDHRTIAELTWNTFRDHTILEYEIPKYDGDLGAPGLFFQLDGRTARRKVRLLMQTFATQRGKDWFTEDTFLALLRLRGVECRAPERFAEAFYCRKAVL